MSTESRTKFKKLKMNCGLIFILNNLSELKATLVGLKGENTQRMNHFCSKQVIYNKYYSMK